MTVRDELFTQVAKAVEAHQPELNVSIPKDIIILDGPFVVSGPRGPFDCYEIIVGVWANFPWEEPIVLETGGRVPKLADRHVFPKKGNCCLGVWEEWLLTAPDRNFETFLTGCLHDYFVSQSWFEAKGEWPYDQRSHDEEGIIESYAELLGLEENTGVIADHLRLLSRAQGKGHARCPCGSGLRLRDCHKDRIAELSGRICPTMAKQMLARIEKPPAKTAGRSLSGW